jgi:8-oxo-dGTP diphosphatase
VQGESPLYQRDPHAWETYLADGNAKQASKRVRADALIRDEAGRVLLVDPGYEPGWAIPGGVAEANESPAECVQRELREELGLDIEPAGLLCVDWVPPHGPWDDLLAFVFDGGLLPHDRAGDIRLLHGELLGFEFCDEAEVARRLRPCAWRRIQGALGAARTGRFSYRQDGNPLVSALPAGSVLR